MSTETKVTDEQRIKRFPIKTFREVQDIQAHFCQMNNFTDTPEKIWKLLQGELTECQEAIELDDLAEIKGELADIVIFAATIATMTQTDLHESITQYDTAFKESADANDGTILAIQSIRKDRKSHDIAPPMLIQYLTQYTKAVESAEQIPTDTKEIFHAVSIISVGVIDIANDYGVNLTDAITQKIDRNYSKYNPYKRKELLASGLDPQKAYQIQKGQWDRGRDKQFIK